jgi:IS30 family transposase
MAAGHERSFPGTYSEVFTEKIRLDDLTHEELDEFVAQIYSRPRKVPGWFTAAEVFEKLCSEGSTG